MKNKKVFQKCYKILVNACLLFIIIVQIYSLGKLSYYNETLNKRITFSQESDCYEFKYAHISVDDTISIFMDLTKNQLQYSSIFDNETLGYFKELHDLYGIKVSFFCFYETDGFNLTKMPDIYKNEFTQNSSWMKFGFHTLNGNLNYSQTTAAKAGENYSKVIHELLRITGSESCIDRMPRLQNYAGNAESIKAMQNAPDGIVGLLTSEDERQNYSLNDQDNATLKLKNYLYDPETGLKYRATDFRVESLKTFGTFKRQMKNISNTAAADDLIIFTHEWMLPKLGIKSLLKEICEYIASNQYRFEFPMYMTK